MADVQALPWPLLAASLVHVLAGLLLQLLVEGLYIVLLVFGVGRLCARIGQLLAFLLAALRHFAIIAVMVASVLAPIAFLQSIRYSSSTVNAQWVIALLVFDYAAIFVLAHWLRKKMFPARPKALGHSGW